MCVSVQATDPDLGASGQVHYRLVNHQKLFSINATGAIRTEVPLDREVGGKMTDRTRTCVDVTVGRFSAEGTCGANGLAFAAVSQVKGHYFLIVEAWDGAVDPRRSRLTLSVTVLDVDDNSPVFARQSYNVSIPENSPKDKVILQLRVSEPMMDLSPCGIRL